MFVMTDSIINGQDPFNHSKVRNVNNSDKWYYNCGGYALGTFSWYEPCTEANNPFGDYEFSKKQMKEWTKYCTEYMLEDFPNMRVIHTLLELKQNEYAIAFRLSSDCDFHYVKRSKNGHWFHKRGASWEIETMTKKEVFSSRWCGRYDGPIVLFAKTE